LLSTILSIFVETARSYATKVIIKYEKTLSFGDKKNFLQCRHAFFSVLLQNIIVFLLTLQRNFNIITKINEYLVIL